MALLARGRATFNQNLVTAFRHSCHKNAHSSDAYIVPAPSARDDFLKCVRALQIAPLQYIAWLRGVALRRHMSEVTGLSQARLANTRQKLRPRKELEIRQHSESIYRSNMLDAGLSEADVDLAHERMRTLEIAGGQTWAAFWTAIDYPLEPELTDCVQAAVKVDKVLESLGKAAEGDNPGDAQKACASFLESWGLPEDISAAEGPGLAASDWHRAQTWDEIFPLADKFLSAVFFDQFAHTDAVWGNSFFSRLEPRPAFALVAPRRRGPARLEKPVRRLLQTSYALHHWARYRTWPAKPPLPGELADALRMRSDDVCNLFDGTTKLHFQHFQNSWDRFGKHFGLKYRVTVPAPLAAVGICWQHNLVSVTPEHKLRSFIILGSGYEQLWRWRRDGLAARSTGSEPWASWMDD